MAGRIRITSGEAEGRVIDIHGELLIGRKGEGQGKLPGDIEISRAHARVYLDDDGGLAIEDVGSTNGTFVGGMRITGPRWLSPGDTIRVGQTTLEVELPEPIPWELAEAEAEPEPAAEAAPPAAEPPEAAPEPEPAAEAPPAAEPEAAPPEAAPPAPEPEAASPEPETAPPEAAPPAPAAEAPPARVAPARGAAPRPLVYVLIGVLVLAALGIAAVVIFTGEDEEETRADPNAQGPPALVRAATEAGCVSRDLPPESNRTVGAETKVSYRSDPPHSGDHAEKPASDGIWETAPPLPKIVASLELGRIVMWHEPGDEKGVRLLREVGDQSPKHMLLVPNATMDYRVAATAWGHLLGCPRINGSTPNAIRAFRDAYRDKGPKFEP